MMWNLLSMSVMLAHKGKIQAKIGVGIPYTQHGSIHGDGRRGPGEGGNENEGLSPSGSTNKSLSVML